MATTIDTRATEKAANEFRKATKLWQILALALADFKKAERSGVGIDMSEWHYVSVASGKCYVCLAGAVIHCRQFGRDTTCRGVDLTPASFAGDDGLPGKLRALDHLRMGSIGFALGAIHAQDTFEAGHKLNRDMPVYSHGKRKWHAAMKSLLADLKKAGL